ncbi:MAG: septum formation inhibitor Maf [Pseudonocardiaceae bacterium]|nr:septum formation inhibitor Maf [Pseudonocardiaceae bacterium]
MRFVLASASPARLAVLRAAGIDPVVRVSSVDEEALAASLPDRDPATLVTALARAKADAVAEAVREEFGDAVVVGCDSMLEHDGQVVGKPGSADVARTRWAAMAGSTGTLFTGHAVLRLAGGSSVDRAEAAQATVVRFGSPSERELEAYLATGEPLGVAGSFTLDGLGGWFMAGVDGDPSSVIGISLPLTRQLLADVGVSVVDLWTA